MPLVPGPRHSVCRWLGQVRCAPGSPHGSTASRTHRWQMQARRRACSGTRANSTGGKRMRKHQHSSFEVAPAASRQSFGRPHNGQRAGSMTASGTGSGLISKQGKTAEKADRARRRIRRKLVCHSLVSSVVAGVGHPGNVAYSAEFNGETRPGKASARPRGLETQTPSSGKSRRKAQK